MSTHERRHDGPHTPAQERVSRLDILNSLVNRIPYFRLVWYRQVSLCSPNAVEPYSQADGNSSRRTSTT